MLLAEDRVLLKRFKEGERQAMSAVFRHYCEPLAGYIRRGLRCPGDGHKGGTGRGRLEAQDLLAETFRRAFEERARLAYDGLSSYEGYLKTIARNLLIDHLRRPDIVRLPEAAVDEDERVSDHEERPPSPERMAEQAELARLLRSFLEPLTQVEQSFVELRFRQGLSQEQVAERLGQTRRFARTLEGDLRRRFIKHMRGTGYLPATSGER